MSNGLFQTFAVVLICVAAIGYLVYKGFKAMQHKKKQGQGCDKCN